MIHGEGARSQFVGRHGLPPAQSSLTRLLRHTASADESPRIMRSKDGKAGCRGDQASGSTSQLRPVCTDFESHAVLGFKAGFESAE